jgi:hypothetical protein
MDVQSPDFERGQLLCDEGGNCIVDIAYVCLDNDALALHAALTLLRHLRPHATPIVVRMASAAGLATLLRADDGSQVAFANLHPFPLLEHTCTPDLVVGGTHELLARAVHEAYVRGEVEKGETPETNPNMVPWEQLPERLRESNRRQADHIGVKLRAVGFAPAPLTDWDAASFEFENAEHVETMARLEHQRWCAERAAEGWTYAPGPKDEQAKTHPDLLPWGELPEAEKDKNRAPVRAIPRILARAGLQVVLVKPEGQ